MPKNQITIAMLSILISDLLILFQGNLFHFLIASYLLGSLIAVLSIFLTNLPNLSLVTTNRTAPATIGIPILKPFLPCRLAHCNNSHSIYTSSTSASCNTYKIRLRKWSALIRTVVPFLRESTVSTHPSSVTLICTVLPSSRVMIIDCPCFPTDFDSKLDKISLVNSRSQHHWVLSNS